MAKFPHNEIISLLDVHLKFNLAESTAADLVLGQIVDDSLLTTFKELKLGYGSSRGHPGLRNEIAHRVGISADKLLITNGAMGSLFLTAFCLCGPGDEIVTVTPNFPLTLGIISAIGATQKLIPLLFDESYVLDLERLSAALSEHTQLVVLVTPHNPSGTAISRKTIEAAVKLVIQKSPQAYILVDENYREATYGDNPVVPSLAGFSERVLTTASLSKCHGAPGIRVGWLTCHEDALMAQLALAKMHTVISSSGVDEAIGLHVFEHSQRILDERKVLLAQGVRVVENWVQNNAEYVEWVRPQAGALCCIRLKQARFDDPEVDRFYEQALKLQVQIASGTWFGEEKRVFRLGFGFLPLPVLEQALLATERALRNAIGSENRAAPTVAPLPATGLSPAVRPLPAPMLKPYPSSITIRRAELADTQAITDIYNEAILTTTATFDTEPKTVGERAQWLQSHDERHPVLVAVVDSQVVGWVSLTHWSERRAYDDTAETSFYVHSMYRGRGIGRRLKDAVIEEARRLRFHTLIARVVEGNRESIHLNESAGFIHVGTMKEVGRKFDRFLDVHMMQKILD